MAGKKEKKRKLTGSVQQKHNTYYVALNTYVDGKRKPTWVPTGLSTLVQGNDEKAREMLDNFTLEYEQIGSISIPEQEPVARKEQGKILFTDHLKRWLENKDVEISTWESYETYVRAHIIPYFEPQKLSIDEVKPKHIKRYYDYLAKEGRKDGRKGGLSKESIKKHASVLNMAFEEAAILEDVTLNPVIGVPVPKCSKAPKQKKVFLSAEQANRLLDAAEGHQLKALIFIALYYGLRRSELVGLKWSAIDFILNKIEINFTVVRVRTTVEKESTKTESSEAVYALLGDVKEVLLLLKWEIEENRKAFGSSYIESDFVFVKPDGERYKPDNVTKMFQTLLRQLGFPKMRLHDLRHSCASVLYEKGWDMKRIQEWMRHSSSNMTSYYTHLTKSVKVIMADDIDSTFRYKADDKTPGSVEPVQAKKTPAPEPEPLEKPKSVINVYQREKLYGEVWNKPVTKVADTYGVSCQMIRKYCKKMNIPVPPSGYWSKVKSGEIVEKPSLPFHDGVCQIRGRRMNQITENKCRSPKSVEGSSLEQAAQPL